MSEVSITKNLTLVEGIPYRHYLTISNPSIMKTIFYSILCELKPCSSTAYSLLSSFPTGLVQRVVLSYFYDRHCRSFGVEIPKSDLIRYSLISGTSIHAWHYSHTASGLQYFQISQQAKYILLRDLCSSSGHPMSISWVSPTYCTVNFVKVGELILCFQPTEFHDGFFLCNNLLVSWVGCMYKSTHVASITSKRLQYSQLSSLHIKAFQHTS